MPKKQKTDEEVKLRLKQEKALRSFAAKKQKDAEKEAKAIQTLATKKVRNPREVLKQILSGKHGGFHNLLPESSPINHSFYNQIHHTKHKSIVNDIILHCYDQDCDFFHFKTIGAVFKGIAEWKSFWLRPLEAWKPQSHNATKQLSSLLRHLFAKYPIPAFMDSAFTGGDAKHQEWFLHIGEGNNIRTAHSLPIPLTRKAAHLMMTAPNDFDIVSAIRWGQIRAMGGDERMIRAIVASTQGFVNNEFWESVFRWFMENPMLDHAQYAPLIDYINHQKFVTVWMDGKWVFPQPNMSMKNRSVDATIKGMEEWHKQSGRTKAHADKYWNSCGFPRFDYQEGNGDDYKIIELLSAKDLMAEGRKMSHCVGSYASSCVTGEISIWSMLKNGSNLMTIQVNNKTRAISQVRGKMNCKPGQADWLVINRWAGQAGLSRNHWCN